MVQLRDLWKANFPYGDATGFKFRPVLVVGASPMGRRQEQVILVAMLTSQVQKRRIGDVTINDWVAAGLEKPTLVKARRLASLNPSQFLDPAEKVGELDHPTFSQVLKEIANLFQ